MMTTTMTMPDGGNLDNLMGMARTAELAGNNEGAVDLQSARLHSTKSLAAGAA